MSEKKHDRPVMHPSIRRLYPKLLLAVVLIALIDMLAPGAFRAGISLPIQIGGHHEILFFPYLPLILLVLLIRPILAHFDSRHVIGEHHIYSVRGRLSLNRRHVEVPFEDIRGVRCEQSPLQRMLNIGTIFAWTATPESPAIQMTDIGDPDHFVTVIREKIDQARMAKTT